MTAITFAPDGATLASASQDSVTLWNVAKRTALWRARIGTPSTALALGMDAIAIGTDMAVVVLEFATGTPDARTSATAAARGSAAR